MAKRKSNNTRRTILQQSAKMLQNDFLSAQDGVPQPLATRRLQTSTQTARLGNSTKIKSDSLRGYFVVCFSQ
jgi:hypothetical protein